ncbi:MAG TPA: hypothetical protein IGS17_16390 [Oscillatoriales cyanobacterium M59_W2019_021]|nr:MAG: hypothetical protein D6728_10410 [Cyanobacteria bacterium J055]HIK32745.1 hypothetical protein [Oscillatoriales cyanobacterium M4454_W2019_049]HIK52484.1 hypothetical protein [Oscillatoriales cyanobacterium M59_W2019_021]
MPKLPINLTRLVVEEELETLLESGAYPQNILAPYIQNILIDEVLCQIPNRYILIEAENQNSLPSLLSCIATCTRLKIEDLLKRSIRHHCQQQGKRWDSGMAVGDFSPEPMSCMR